MTKISILKNYPIAKKILISILSLTIVLVIFFYWFKSVLPVNYNPEALKGSMPQDLVYLQQGVKEQRGKILAVVTSTNIMGSSGKSTGYELTELARAYSVFKANGFDVDVASPKGGLPPVVIDADDMGYSLPIHDWGDEGPSTAYQKK